MNDDVSRSFSLFGEGPFKVLGVASGACFPLALPLDQVKKFTGQTLSYWAEEYVPIAAEELAWWKSGALLIATDGSAIQKFLSALPSPEPVIAALPNAWLAAIQVLRLEKVDSAKICIGYTSHCEELVVVKNHLKQWRWLRWDELASLSESDKDTNEFAVGGLPLFILEEAAPQLPVENKFSETGKRISESVDELARTSAERITAGQCDGRLSLYAPSVPQLKSDAPTGKWQNLLMFLGILVLFSLGFSFQYRTWAYRQLAQEEASESVRAYQAVFPGTRIPTGLLVRMESEYKKLKAIKLGDGKDQPDNTSCLAASVALWKALDSVDGYEIERLQLQGDKLVSLSGNCTSFEEMDNLRQALLREGFQVPVLSSSTSNRGAVLEVPVSPWKRPSAMLENLP